MNKTDSVVILSYIAGLSFLVADTTFKTSIDTLFGPFGAKIIAALALASVLATGVLHIISKGNTNA